MLHAAEGSKGSLLLTGAPWHMLDMPVMGMSTMAASAKENDCHLLPYRKFSSSQEPEMVTPGISGLYAH